MANLQIVISQNGPVPISVQFDAQADGPLTFFLSGSAWSNQPGQWVGVAMELDGVPIGSAAVFCNEATSHRALVATLSVANVTFGQHNLTLLPTSQNTVTDVNDFFQVAIFL